MDIPKDIIAPVIVAVAAAAIISGVGWLYRTSPVVSRWLQPVVGWLVARPPAVAAFVALLTAVFTTIIMLIILKPINDLPKEAIVAFARERGCPQGWSLFKPATARVIVGAGIDFDSAYSRDDRNEVLKPKGYREARGEQTHLLTKAELPAEPVVFAVFVSKEFSLVNTGGYTADRFVGADPKSGNPPLGTGGAGTFGKRITDPMGNGTAYNVLPPYLALYYCQKEDG